MNLLDEMDALIEAQDALDNREYNGTNAEDYFVLLGRRNVARDHYEAARASHVREHAEFQHIVKRLAAIRDGLDNGNSAAEHEACRLAELASAAIAKATGGVQ